MSATVSRARSLNIVRITTGGEAEVRRATNL
jgi:hypothetical protein